MAGGEARTTQWFTVPAGTPASECRGCKATVYWIVTENDRRMPVNCDVPGGTRPIRFPSSSGATLMDNGRGLSHFADCPNWERFRKVTR
jgi:hypothetical protein